MSFEFWLIYAATIFIASIVPGPSMLLALTHGIRYGAGRAMFSGLGNVAASMLQAGVSIAGLGVLLTASQPLFLVIKYAGAAYLVWLGFTVWRAPAENLDIDTRVIRKASKPAHRLFLDAFMVALGNPKAIVFFSALFPQFIGSDGVTALECFLMLFVMAVLAFVAWMIYAFGGEKIAGMFRRFSIGRIVNRVLGTTFIGAGIGLAVSER
ncbi:LysE family translocator [Salidesulfovibrio onnuriiensis]|uniref:LysE family translocator n=1 Tax=Salidesulfovibrio onnuriiensis TaxID=2583823 RepID=UPI0011C8473E|nr:LysE family translocator [Salidesulfovibrio onnuriiensis]